MMLAWRLESETSRSDRRRFQRKASSLPQYAVGSIDRNGFLWSEAKGFCACGTEAGENNCVSSSLHPGRGPSHSFYTVPAPVWRVCPIHQFYRRAPSIIFCSFLLAHTTRLHCTQSNWHQFDGPVQLSCRFRYACLRGRDESDDTNSQVGLMSHFNLLVHSNPTPFL